MMATQTTRTHIEEDSKPAAVMKQAVQSNAPTKESALSLERDLSSAVGVIEKREPAPGAPKMAAKGGKNALLAKVKAAQERARSAQEAKKKALRDLENVRLEEERILKGLEEELANEEEATSEKGEEDLTNTNSDLFVTLNKTTENSANPSHDAIQSAPIAPLSTTVADEFIDLLSQSTIVPVQPPTQEPSATAPPPSFDEIVEHTQEDLAAFQLDTDGNDMSPEEQQRMMKEQEEILRQIQEEKEANERVINELMQGDSATAAANRAPSAAITGSVQSENLAASSTVQIAPNKRVALHGQDRTKAAIAAGTAVLVQCVYCQNWMQVTPSATLMFCPVCQVVSPVQHQTTVMTTEDAVRMSLDRKMAENMQNEEYEEQREEQKKEEGEGIMGKLKSSIWGGESSEQAVLVTNHGDKVAPDGKQSWGDYISSLMPIANEQPDVPNQGSAEIVIGSAAKRKKQPQASSAQKMSPKPAQVNGNEEENVESESLLPGRVAESKPLFSCMVEQVSNILGGSTDLPEEGEVHGVDASSLLSVPDVRNKDGSGGYAALGSEDKI